MRFSATIVFIALFLTTNINGQIFCPDDIVTSCFSSLTLEECGNATVVSGNYNTNQVKFVDDRQVNACNEGVVFRQFYIDVDYSNTFTEGEPFCTQTISLLYDELPLNIQYPSEVVLNCLDELPNQSPTWSSHPCDLVGYTYVDEIFEFEAGACLKVVRTFSVINWCEYEGGTGSGLYTGIQIIKVVDNEAPEIQNCEDLVFDAVENCEATITLHNTANDAGDCPSSLLQWTLSVDLWADGTEDLFYGPNEPQPFQVDKIENGVELSITLPEAVGIANHKLVWKVTDGCGNVRSCSSLFEVKDNKPPTPYCKNFLSATLNGDDGGQLVIPAVLFDNGAYDNCSSQEEIRISFSDNVNDTERTIECGEIGFQFFRVYYTDAAGNQDFCEVIMFVLDNGSCAGKFEPEGRVVTRSGIPQENVSTYLMDEEGMVTESVTAVEGNYTFGDQSLMENYYAEANKEDDPLSGVDILDYQIMLDGALGKRHMDYYCKIAADLNDDGHFNLDDLDLFREVLTGASEFSSDNVWKFVPISQQTNNENAIFSPSFSIMDYQHGFNFWAIKKGDLTDAEFVEESNIANESIDLLFTIENDEVVITNPESFKTGFYSIELNIENEMISDILSSGKKYENKSSSRILNLNNEFITFNENDINLSIEYKSDQDALQIKNALIENVSFINEAHNGISNINWIVNDNRNEKPLVQERSKSINVFPTIFENEITIVAQDIQTVSLKSYSGLPVDLSMKSEVGEATIKTSNHLPSGIYFLTVISSAGKQVFTVVK
ncbi:MAG: hypothetical protein ACJA1A_003704 [Saprospiraceae bacterium]|jgi:hypothetical protein